MKCKKVQKLLPEYLEDTLTESKATFADEHIQNCDACRRELSAFGKTIRLASSIQVEYVMNRYVKLALIIFGIALIIDGLGSIYVYQSQPVWPDHAVRLARSGIGAIIAYIGWKF